VASYNWSGAFVDADGLSLGGLAAIGANVAYATAGGDESDGNTSTYIDGEVDGGGNLMVLSEVDALADSETEAASASFGGSIVVNIAESVASPTIRTSIGLAGSTNPVLVGGDLTVRTDSDARAITDADGKSAGLGAFGGMVANSYVKPEIDTYIDGTTDVIAGGGVTVESLHNEFYGDAVAAPVSATALADAPAFGVYFAGSGTLVDAEASADIQTMTGVDTTITAGGMIAVRSIASNVVFMRGEADTTGAAAIGIMTTTGVVDSRVLAHVNGDITTGGGLVIDALAVENVDLRSQVTSGAFFGSGTASLADASLTSIISSGIADNTLISGLSGDVSITAISQANVKADARGTTGGAVDVGTGQATANLEPVVDATIGTKVALETTGSVSLLARHNTDTLANKIGLGTDTESTGFEDIQGALARSFAPGAGLASLKFTKTEANANALVEAGVAKDSTITAGGAVSIASQSVNSAKALSRGITATGLGGIGGTEADAEGSGVTRSYMDGEIGTTVTAGASSLSVETTAQGLAMAKADAATGGLLGGINSVDASAKVYSIAEATLAGDQVVHVSGDIVVATYFGGRNLFWG
jgi:hypothetical protein